MLKSRKFKVGAGISLGLVAFLMVLFLGTDLPYETYTSTGRKLTYKGMVVVKTGYYRFGQKTFSDGKLKSGLGVWGPYYVDVIKDGQVVRYRGWTYQHHVFYDQVDGRMRVNHSYIE